MSKYANYDLERRILSHHIRYEKLNLKLEYFTIPEAKQLFNFIEERNIQPIDSLQDLWDLWLPNLSLWCSTDTEIETYKHFLTSLFVETRLTDIEKEILLEELDGYYVARKLYTTLAETIRLFKSGEVVKAKQLLVKSVKDLETNTQEVVERWDLEDIEQRLSEYLNSEHALTPTFIPELDRIINGVAPTSLNFIQGETGIGKTFFLCELAYRAFINGLNVLFITIELREKEIAIRLDSRISQIPMQNFRNNLNASEIQKLKNMLQKQWGKIGISFIPEGCSITAVQAEFDVWTKKWGSQPNIVIIDYADLMATTRKYYSEQELQGNIFRDLKRFSQENKIIVWTASQVSLKSYSKAILSLEDLGYSARKGNWANLILGISMDQDYLGMLNVNVIKNTFGDKGSCVLRTNYDYATIGE